MRRRIVITGGAGFIGRELSHKMKSANTSVVILDSFLSSSTVDDPLIKNKTDETENLRVIKADLIDDTEHLDREIQECDLVFHLAENMHVGLGSLDTPINFQNNIVATRNVLEAVRKSHRCNHIIFTSSSTVYGEPSTIPTPENYGPLIPISFYGSSKLACEALISGYCSSFSMSGIILRLANVVGPLSSHGVIHDFVRKLCQNPLELMIRGNGKQQKSYIYIEDCIKALCLASKKLEKLAPGSIEVYNVGSNDTVTVKEIADIVVSSLQLKDVKIVYTNGNGGRGWTGDVRKMLLDSSRFEGEGWRADLNSRDAVMRTVMGICRNLTSTC